MNAKQQFGRAAEEAAARYLVRDGWTLLGRNVRIGRGELDLIARRGDVLAFVEVKARRTAAYGAPEDAVDARKRRKVARLAELWLAVRPWALARRERRALRRRRRRRLGAAAGRCVTCPGAFTLDG